MKMKFLMFIAICSVLYLTVSCSTQKQAKQDVINETFSEAQAELQIVLKEIYDDAMNANINGLAVSHLISPKFTKFGPRSFERQTVENTNISEASFFSSVSELKIELEDVKIDVFGDVAITTYYPNFSFVKEDQLVEGSSRQTLIFLKTDDGWKIIHEHGTPKKFFSN